MSESFRGVNPMQEKFPREARKFCFRKVYFLNLYCRCYTLESRYRRTSIVGQNATYRRKPEVLNVNRDFAVSPNIYDTFLLKICPLAQLFFLKVLERARGFVRE